MTMSVITDEVLLNHIVKTLLYGNDLPELYATKGEVDAARKGEPSLETKIDIIVNAINGLNAGSGLLNSINDQVAGYIEGKIFAGDGLKKTINNPGGDESATFSLDYDPLPNLKKFS